MRGYTDEIIDVLQQVLLGHVKFVQGDVDLEVLFREREVLIHLGENEVTKQRWDICILVNVFLRY